jgi:hypothetical protein
MGLQNRAAPLPLLLLLSGGGGDDGEAREGVGGRQGLLVGTGCCSKGGAAGLEGGVGSLSLKENKKLNCKLQYSEITYVGMSLCC